MGFAGRVLDMDFWTGIYKQLRFNIFCARNISSAGDGYCLAFVRFLVSLFSATLLFYEDQKPVHLPLHGLGAASNASGQRPPFRIRDLQCLGWSPLSEGLRR